MPMILKVPGLAPAKLFPGLCLVRNRVSTTSEPCQSYFDQGLGYFYSYVWMEAARSFETATRHDPDCYGDCARSGVRRDCDEVATRS